MISKDEISQSVLSVWVPIHVHQLAAPKIVWVDRHSPIEVAKFNTAYCIPAAFDLPSAYTQETRQAWADRYGGIGVGFCGGSARCGVIDGVQVKGIGLTPLHGSERGAPPDPWHSSGTLDLTEAGREAIWSSVCQAVLPYGAVRAHAIVLTRTRTSPTFMKKGFEQANPRALLIRDFALRPAHFLRNLRFDSAVRADSGLSTDSERTQAAIKELPKALREAFGLPECDHAVNSQIGDGLVAMARRFAIQVAAAFAKRLLHGGLCCSNIALDGRFLDFGTMTAVDAYRRRAGAPSPAGPDLWIQHAPLVATLVNLCQHVARYQNAKLTAPVITPNELVQEFAKTMEERTAIEFLKLTGVPERAVMAWSDSKRSAALGVMRDVFTRGASRFVWRGDDDESVAHLKPLASTGRFDLNGALGALASVQDEPERLIALSKWIDDRALAHRMNDACTELMTHYLTMVPDAQRHEAMLRANAESRRLNGSLSFLTREAIDAALTGFGDDSDGMSRYIDDTIERALLVLRDGEYLSQTELNRQWGMVR